MAKTHERNAELEDELRKVLAGTVTGGKDPLCASTPATFFNSPTNDDKNAELRHENGDARGAQRAPMRLRNKVARWLVGYPKRDATIRQAQLHPPRISPPAPRGSQPHQINERHPQLKETA